MALLPRRPTWANVTFRRSLNVLEVISFIKCPWSVPARSGRGLATSPISGGTSALAESLARLFCLFQKQHTSKNLSFQLLVPLDTPLKIDALIIRDLIKTYYIPWDFKFSRRLVWCSELSSGIYCRVKWLSTDVSEVRTAPNFLRVVGGSPHLYGVSQDQHVTDNCHVH
jgi:hypothetical protein